MRGEFDLSTLLRSMDPTLSETEYVFSTIGKEQLEGRNIKALMQFREEEGVTLILDRNSADTQGLTYENTWALITLSVHSDLEAVGFIARVSSELAKEGISVNVVSAFYHDHLFVPHEEGEDAMEILNRLSENP